MMTGKVFKYSANVDTDAIIPARYLNVSEPAELAQHCMEDIDTDFVKNVHKGDIIVATTTPDQVFPSTACLLQYKLGVGGCPAFDLQAVCSGFVYALATADQFIKSGAARCALVVGAETMSRITDWSDRNNCILWGDGAGAST